MKQRVMTVLMTAILLAALAGCGQQEELRETQRQLEQTQQQLEQLQQQLDETTVDEQDIYNVKVEQDGDNGIPIYDIEFETDYGDYDFEVAIADGRIVGADYEVDEEWLDTLGGSPVDQDGVRQLVAAKVPGASAQDVQVREEGGDGRGRYEGELYHDSMKYEFEVDPRTGRIFDWAADWRG